MITSLLDVARRHIILFGAMKFGAGLLVGFALGVYFLPILTAEDGLDSATLAQLEVSAERRGTFTRDLADVKRKPDRWQPRWIREKYFGSR